MSFPSGAIWEMCISNHSSRTSALWVTTDSSLWWVRRWWSGRVATDLTTMLLLSEVMTTPLGISSFRFIWAITQLVTRLPTTITYKYSTRGSPTGCYLVETLFRSQLLMGSRNLIMWIRVVTVISPLTRGFETVLTFGTKSEGFIKANTRIKTKCGLSYTFIVRVVCDDPEFQRLDYTPMEPEMPRYLP